MEASKCLGLHLLILSFPCRTASGFPWAPVKWSGAPGVPETGDVVAWAYSDISSRCSARAGVSAVLQTQLGLGPLTLLGLPASFCSLLSSASLWSRALSPSLSPAFMSLQTAGIQSAAPTQTQDPTPSGSVFPSAPPHPSGPGGASFLN